MKLSLKVLIFGSAVATLGQSTICRGHGMTPEFAVAIMLGTLRICETTYPDIQPSLVSVRDAWQTRNAPLLTSIETTLASMKDKVNMQSLVDMFVEQAKKEKKPVERSVCEQMVSALADPRRDAEVKAWFSER